MTVPPTHVESNWRATRPHYVSIWVEPCLISAVMFHAMLSLSCGAQGLNLPELLYVQSNRWLCTFSHHVSSCVIVPTTECDYISISPMIDLHWHDGLILLKHMFVLLYRHLLYVQSFASAGGTNSLLRGSTWFILSVISLPEQQITNNWGNGATMWCNANDLNLL